MSKGSLIKQLRESCQYSQTEFAKLIRVSKQSLYKYENDIITNIPSDKIELIAQICCVSPAYLMGWTDDPRPAAPAEAAPARPSSLQSKIDRLDDIDLIKTEAYVDGLLSQEKYQKDTSAEMA